MSYEDFFYNDVSNKSEYFEYIINKYSLDKDYTIIKQLVTTSSKFIAVVAHNETLKKYTLKIKYTNIESEYFEGRIYKILKDFNNIKIGKPVVYYNNSPYHVYLYEYVDGIDLFYFIEDCNLSDKELICFSVDIVTTLIELHSHNIIHCDIKLENIIISHGMEAYLIDFEYSKIEDNANGILQENIVGTNEYVAPESRDLSIYSKKTDIWQFGVLIYVLVTGKFPLNKSKKNEKKRNEFKHINYEILREKIKENSYNDKWFDIITRCLSFKDFDRPTSTELLEIIKKIDV